MAHAHTITVAQIAERRWHPIYAAIPPHHRVHDGLHLCLSHVGPKGIPRTPAAGRSPCQAILLGQGERKTEGKHSLSRTRFWQFSKQMHAWGQTYQLRPGILVNIQPLPSRASAAARGAAPESGAEPSCLAAACTSSCKQASYFVETTQITKQAQPNSNRIPLQRTE